MQKTEGQSTSIYRSRANFFCVEQELFRSEYTFKRGDYEWPFDIAVPEKCDIGSTGKNEKESSRFKAREGYLGNEAGEAGTDGLEGAANVVMPSTMQYYHGIFGQETRAFVECVLVATVLEGTDGKTWNIGGPKKRTSVLVLPFVGMRERTIQDFGERDETSTMVVKNARLHPGSNTDDGNPISTPEPRSSIRSLLRNLSTSAPKLGLNISVHYPTVLQVHHPCPIPFSITINSNQPISSLPAPSLPRVLVRSFSLQLICQTYARVLRGWKFGDIRDAKTVTLKLADNLSINENIDWLASNSLVADGKGSPSTYDGEAGTSEGRNSEKAKELAFDFQRLTLSNDTNERTVDLGTVANLRLTSAKIGKIHEPILLPSFLTYNIGRRFGLKWVIELEITCQGKVQKEKIKGEVPKGGVRVVGIADEARESLNEGVDTEMHLEALNAEDLDEAPSYDDIAGESSVGGEKGRSTKREGLMEKGRFVEPADEDDGQDRLPRYEG